MSTKENDAFYEMQLELEKDHDFCDNPYCPLHTPTDWYPCNYCYKMKPEGWHDCKEAQTAKKRLLKAKLGIDEMMRGGVEMSNQTRSNMATSIRIAGGKVRENR